MHFLQWESDISCLTCSTKFSLLLATAFYDEQMKNRWKTNAI